MKQFGSGIIGCVICVLALMGSILGGFVLDVDKDTRETTDYNYITDITGLFSTENTPKYIDYNPSTNFIGYPEQTVEYIDSTVPNNYRYVADSGLTTTINYSQYISNSNIPALDGGNMHTPYFINYIGTRYNFGTATTWNGISYNIIANGQNDGTPCITTLYTIMTERGLTSGEYNLYDSGYPVIIYNGTFSHTSKPLYNPIKNVVCQTATIDDDCFPTRIVYNSPNVTAYNGSTQLWSAVATSVYVIYDYGIMTGGSYTPVNVDTHFQYYLNGSFTVTNATTFNALWQPDAHSVFNYSNLYLYYSGTEYDFGEERRGNGNLRYNAILVKDTSNTYFCASPIQSVLYAALGTTSIPEYSATNQWYEIEIENHGNPIFIGRTIQDYQDSATSSAEIIVTDNMIADRIRVMYSPSAPTGGYVIWYNGNTSLGNDDLNDRCIIWGYIPNNQNSLNVNTTFNVVMGPDGHVGSGDAFTYPDNIQYGNVTLAPFMGFNYTGTFGYDFGTSTTDHNLTYNGYITTYMDVNTNPATGPYISAYNLTELLNRINVPDSTTANIEITYGPNDTSPMFFMHDQSWTQTTWSLNNNTIKGYATTFNDSNFPTRFTWNTQTNWVTMYNGNTLLYSDSASNISVATAIECMNGGTSMMVLHVEGIIKRVGTSITDIPNITDSSDYTINTDKFPTAGTTTSTFINLTGTSYDLGSTTFQSITYNISCASQEIPEESATYYPKITRFSDIIGSIDTTDYSTIIFTLNQNGNYPILFYTGSWQHIKIERNDDVQQYVYYATMNYMNIPNKIVYDCATGNARIYVNDSLTTSTLTDNIDVIYSYSAKPSNGSFAPATTNCSITGLGMPHSRYAYMDPTRGVILNMPSTIWENGYDNNDIYITMVRERANTINELSINADTSSITVRTVGNTMTAYITKYDGTTDTKTIGTWAACQVHINASAGTVSLTPLQGPVSYTNNVPENATTTTWTGWYNGEDITQLMIATTQQSMRFSITNTNVFLNTYGVVMQDPSINVSSYFPEYEEWRLNFYSFALVGDSMTVNGQTFNVNEDQKITVTGEDGKTITGTLSNIYVTEKDDHTYFTFTDGKETVDLGETVNNTVSFAGRWYFTTGLYEGVDGVEEYYDWNLDGNFHATMAETCLIFLGLLVFGVIIGKVTLGLTLKSIDGIILISVTVIALIIAGGAI